MAEGKCYYHSNDRRSPDPTCGLGYKLKWNDSLTASKALAGGGSLPSAESMQAALGGERVGILNFFKSYKSQAAEQAKIQELIKNSSWAKAPVKKVEKVEKADEFHEVREVKAMDTAEFLKSDDKEWIRYLGQALRTYRKPGVTLKEEYDTWMAARIRSRSSASVANGRTAKS